MRQSSLLGVPLVWHVLHEGCVSGSLADVIFWKPEKFRINNVSDSTTKNVPYLDGWRGVAILAVLASHFGSQKFGWLGGFGVAIFFVLSGYLMSYLLFIKRVNLPDFFARRFSRVFPAFFVFLCAMLAYATTLQPTKYFPRPAEALAMFSFAGTYFPSDISIWTEQWPVGHLWSLNVEEHSYVFLAVLTLLMRFTKYSWSLYAALVASCVVILALNFYYPTHPPLGASPWFTRSECAALALIAAASLKLVRHHSANSLIHEVPSLLPILTFLIAAACFSTYGHKGVQYTVAPLCLAYTINYLDRTPTLIKWILSWPLLRWFGTYSFSIYLWQQPFTLASRYFGMPALLAFGLALTAGIISFHFIEQPFRTRLNKAWSERRTTSENAAEPSGAPPR